MPPLACKLCLLTRPLRGSDLAQAPQSEEELVQHIEREHHVPVRRAGETQEAATVRFQRENPEAGGSQCRCPRCQLFFALDPGDLARA